MNRCIFILKEVSTISSYKKQFAEVNKCLTRDENELFKVRADIAALKEKERQLEKKVEEDRQNKVVKGMLYFSDDQRTSLLTRAEDLQYSKKTIDRLRTYTEQQWNADYVNYNTIEDFEAVEKYVNENEPDWEQGILAKIGKSFLQNR